MLKRGFAWVRGDDNKTIYTLQEAKKQQTLNIKFADGELTTQTDNKNSSKIKKEEKSQGSLFDF